MTTFTLGTKPPHIDHVRTFADTEDGESTVPFSEKCTHSSDYQMS
jgi:Ca2+-dependent lipid-binding protein